MAGLSRLKDPSQAREPRAAFANFEIDTVAGFGTDDVERLLPMRASSATAGRSRRSSTTRRCFETRDEFGSLAAYAWGYEPDLSTRPAVLDREALMQLGISPGRWR